jgi:hypothetical protein
MIFGSFLNKPQVVTKVLTLFFPEDIVDNQRRPIRRVKNLVKENNHINIKGEFFSSTGAFL